MKYLVVGLIFGSLILGCGSDKVAPAPNSFEDDSPGIRAFSSDELTILQDVCAGYQAKTVAAGNHGADKYIYSLAGSVLCDGSSIPRRISRGIEGSTSPMRWSTRDVEDGLNSIGIAELFNYRTQLEEIPTPRAGSIASMCTIIFRGAVPNSNNIDVGSNQRTIFNAGKCAFNGFSLPCVAIKFYIKSSSEPEFTASHLMTKDIQTVATDLGNVNGKDLLFGFTVKRDFTYKAACSGTGEARIIETLQL